LVTILLKVEDGGELSEDQAHKMFTFKVDDVIVKWYSTTNTVQTQGAGYASPRESLARVYSLKEELLALHDSVHMTIDHLPAPPDESHSPTANFGPSQESRSSIPQSNEVACGACTTIKSDLRVLEQQFNELRNLVLTKINMQIGISTPEGIDLQKENSDLRGRFE